MKKPFVFFDKSIWDRFIRGLFYPALLGSLIYDFTNFEPNNKYLLLFITAIFYLTDYFYLTAVLDESPQKSDKPYKIFLDFFVAFLFGLIIYSIHYKEYYIISIASFLIFVSAFVYFPNTKTSFGLFFSLIILSILIVCFQYMILNCCKCDIKIISTWIYSIMVFLYFVAVSIDSFTFNKNKKEELLPDPE